MANRERSPYGSTATVAGFITSFRLNDLPDRAREVVKTGLLDSIGVGLAGSAHPAGKITADFVSSQGSGRSTIWGHGVRAPVALAALANGTAAHALDYDDVNWALTGHPSVSLTPAVLALAERDGASGAAIVEAYACGFEVMAKIGLTCMPEHSFDGGWHATSSIGTIGATAACARLLGLTTEQAVSAVGIAVSRASGVVQNFGTMTKPLHAGLAAEGGILAAELARRGFTASSDAMEGKHGFYATFSRGLPLRLERIEELGRTFELEISGLLIKPYPCGVAGHAAIDAALWLRNQLTALEIQGIEKIEVGATSYTLDKMRYLSPENELEAKFSLTYQVARALLDGKLTLSHFEPQAVQERSVRALESKVILYRDKDIDQTYKARKIGGKRPCRVSVTLADGRVLSHLVEASTGDPEAPMTRSQLLDKFNDCASTVLDADKMKQVSDMVLNLEGVSNASDLCDILRGE